MITCNQACPARNPLGPIGTARVLDAGRPRKGARTAQPGPDLYPFAARTVPCARTVPYPARTYPLRPELHRRDAARSVPVF
eukprot:1966383-Rhodomonas_salina.2